MVRTFDSLVFCPHCGRSHTAESAFERWMRGYEALDSRHGIVRFDLDVLVHRYMTVIDKKGRRDLQCIQFIEVKTHGAELRPAQQDTLSMLSQVLLNRKTNVERARRGLHAKEHMPPCVVHSKMHGRDVRIRMYGGHLLTLSGQSPDDSEWMTWDKKPIDCDQLVSLLRFDLDPHSLRPTDWRRRYSAFNEPTLFAVPQRA